MEKVNKILFSFFILLLPWQIRWIVAEHKVFGQVWEYGRFSLYVSMIVLAILFVLAFIKHQRPENRKIFWFALTLVYLLVVNIFSALPTVSFYLLSYLVGFCCLLFVLYKQEQKLVYISLFASGFIQGLLAIWQTIVQKIPAQKFFGLAEHLPETLGVSVVQYDLNRILRAYGAFTHPNILGGFLVLASLAGFWCWLHIYTQAKAENWHGPKIKFLALKLVLVLIALMIVMLGLLFSFSRGAILALCLAVLFLFIKSLMQRQYLKLQVVVKMLLLFLTLIFLVEMIFPGVWRARLTGSGDLEQQSITQRLSGLKQINWHDPKVVLFGQGLGVNTYVNLQEGQMPYEVQPIHNIFLLSLAEIGVVGFILLLNLWRVFFWQTWKKLFNVWLLVFVILGFFDHYLWTAWSGVLMLSLIFYFYEPNLNKQS